jgi:GlpG protein
MGGYQFVGLSGVICGMIMFVWTRNSIAPWEGYQLDPKTMRFLTIFIVGVAIGQTVAFLSALAGLGHFSLGIANTAHIMGGVVGWALAKMEVFAWKR